MYERYEHARSSGVQARARYSSYRRFSVETTEEVALPAEETAVP